jgi:MEMO1 family protein
MMSRTTVRLPTVAGQFYPKQEQELSRQVEFFLSKSSAKLKNKKQDFPKKTPKILIVPHAGYQYSGQVAADGFIQLKDSAVKNVFLLGNSHQTYLHQASLSGEKHWQTPLGNVELNQKVINDLAERPGWEINDQPHQYEHSLEVQLPFLQQVLSSFTIVPILISSFEFNFLTTLAQDLAEQFNQPSLLVISSDLSHYPNAELAQKADRELIQAIEEINLEKFKSLVVQTAPEKNLQTRACGAESIKIGLMLAELLDCQQTQLYSYQHSGAISQNLDKVVGYASIGIY